MKRRFKLKKWVKVGLINIFFVSVLSILFLLIFLIISKRYDDLYAQCEEAKGHVCSYYEMRQYAIKGE